MASKRPYSPAEDSLIMADEINYPALSAQLGRTVHALYQRRSWLRKASNAPAVKQLFTAYEDEQILAASNMRRLAQKLNRPYTSIRHRRRLLLNQSVETEICDTPPFTYADPLDKLFEPDVPQEVYTSFEQWWHWQSPPTCYDREQVQMAWLHGYAASAIE
jgi:hypothetical protein